MDIWVLDKEFNQLAIIDSYESIIWNERYDSFGDFELYAPFSSVIFSEIQIGYYLVNTKMDTVMIVEDILVDTSLDNGAYITVRGRSLESILDRRIIWKQKRFKGKLENQIESMLNDNIINPEDDKRKIPKFVFLKSGNKDIDQIEIDKQYTGDNLYNAISDLCYMYDLGFRIRLTSEGGFSFQLYKGEDRSYSQESNSYVVFAPSFENIMSSNYQYSYTDLKTVTLVAGEDQGEERFTVEVDRPGYSSFTGIDRREMYTDARDIRSTDDSKEPDEEGNYPELTPEEYSELLTTRGLEYLYENNDVNEFSGEVDTQHIFIYNRDYFIGDIVQLVGPMNNPIRARIIESIYSQDSSGVSLHPTFELIEDIEEEEVG